MSKKQNETIIENQEFLKLGGVLALIGGLGYFVTLLFHGDLPDQTTEIALNYIAGRPEWSFLKLSLMTNIMLWVGAFVALASTFSRGASWLLGHMAVACLLVGAAIVFVEYSILGHEMPKVAAEWQMATGQAKAEKLLVAETLLSVTSGLFLSFLIWLIGVPYMLLGLSVAFGRDYPRWLGWLAFVLGAGVIIAGTTRFLGINLVPFPVLYGGFIIPLNLWLVAMGVLMWRRAGQFKTND